MSLLQKGTLPLRPWHDEGLDNKQATSFPYSAGRRQLARTGLKTGANQAKLSTLSRPSGWLWLESASAGDFAA